MQFFNFHTHIHTNQSEVLELVNQYPQDFDDTISFYSIGIHPWFIDEEQVESHLQILENKLRNANCLAVGECGLDKRIENHRKEIPFDLQLRVFKKQLLLAEKYQKPVVVHCVAAFQELIALKKELGISVPMIIHGFSKNAQLAKQLLDNGFYLSFGKYLLRNPELKPVFQSIPNNRFFLETDTVEERIQDVYVLAAKYKGIEVQNLQEIINKNFNKIFKKSVKQGL